MTLRFFWALFLLGTTACRDRGEGSGVAAPPAEEMKPFKCELEMELNGESYVARVSFYDQIAVEHDPAQGHAIAAVYSLESRLWDEFSRPRTVTLRECEQWASMSRKRSLESIESSTDEAAKRVAEALLRPNFEVSASGESVTLWNDVIKYTLTDPLDLDPTQRRRFFDFDRLNAYRKAMTQGQMGPFAQLAVRNELLKRGFVPGRMEMVMATGKRELTATVSAKISEIDEVELENLKAAVDEAMRSR